MHGEAIVLVGNPNVGKSAVFGCLTGRYVTVANYPGTTVELASGRVDWNGRHVRVVDTPGVDSLLAGSEEARVTRELLLDGAATVVVQVADAKNLRRALMLSIELTELGIPFLLDLNMIDEAEARAIRIETAALSDKLGVPVCTTVATRRQGIDHLQAALAGELPLGRLAIRYPAEVEQGLAEIERLLPPGRVSRRGLALLWLSRNANVEARLGASLEAPALARLRELRDQLEARWAEPLWRVFYRAWQHAAQQLLLEVYRAAPPGLSLLAERVGAVAMHPLWGLLVAAAILYVMYEFVGVLAAGTIVDLLEEGIFSGYIVPAAQWFVDRVLPVPLIHRLLVGEYGLISMALSYSIAIVLPVVGAFFLAFGAIEDSGYLPRLAVMLDRVFRAMGLNGKAVLPMVLGLGCDTMATLTTRILETRKERLLVTLLLALAIPCSAQLGVILGMLGALSPGATAIWLGVLVAVLLAVGHLASRLIPGERSDFILELPPMRWPALSNIGIKTLARVEWYLKEAVPLFFLGTFLLFVLAETNLLAWLERAATPLVEGLLGLPAAATGAFIVGFLRRDYGAAGFFQMSRMGILDPVQTLVSLVTITLFVPCVANLFIIIKERGTKAGLGIVLFIFPFAFAVGAALNALLRALGGVP